MGRERLRDAAKHPALQRTDPSPTPTKKAKNYPIQSVLSAKIEKPCPKLK